LLLLFFIVVPIIIGFSVVASNAHKRREEGNLPSIVASSMSPTPSTSLRATKLPTVHATTTTTTATSAPSTVHSLLNNALTLAPTSAMTISPTSTQRQALLNILVPLSLDNGTSLLTTGSPQYKALEWAMMDSVGGSTARFLQRYALATLYYSTNGASTGTSSWLNASGWLSPDDECTWYGTSCIGDSATSSLTGLQLTNNQLSGSIPNELSLLTTIKNFSLTGNALRATIPTAIGLMTSLTVLDLSSNSLSGTLLTEIGRLSSLNTLLLQDNLLTGTIPTELAKLLGLQLIRLNSNKLTGTIPDTVGYAFSASQPRFYSDCAASSPIVCPAYPCCTYCCDGGGVCSCMYAGTGFDFLC
jgi:Leucine-rich repeat (LRR) protein